jgi:hypothetical protein
MRQAVVNRYGEFGFCKVWGLYPLTVELSASQEELCSIELSNYVNMVVN